MPENEERISSALLNLKSTIPPNYLFPVLDINAYDLIPSNPYAFCIAACLDRGTRAEIIWTIPFWLKNITGYMEPDFYYRLSISEIENLFTHLPRKPRYINAAPHTLVSLTKLIVEGHDGDPTKIWVNRKARETKRGFLRVFGVGEGISNLILLLLEEAYHFEFSDIDHSIMDIKPDVHTMRVLFRLGASERENDQEAIYTARILNPNYPGALDGPLWYLGRQYCRAQDPKCTTCPVSNVCIKRVV